MIVLLSLVVVLTAVVFIYMLQPKFGESPSGARLARIKKSGHYQDGEFRNMLETPTFADGYGFWSEIRKQLFGKYPRLTPEGTIPSQKTDLLHLPADSNVLVWLGHSSSFIQLNGKKILIDPVFSGNASPIPGTVKPFKGSAIYTVDDIPAIDYLLISHDHYDHLDYETVLALKDRTKKVICGLGVGAHFERWGYAPAQLIEKDWHEQVTADNGTIFFIEPARHKSGRGIQQNNTLWVSYLIQTPSLKIYFSGDSGYGDHFAEIGKRHGPVDLALMENGQYDSAWHYIHMLPEETLKAAQDLQARRMLPVHNSKFLLARHAWDGPMADITRLNTKFHITLVTPVIGQKVSLTDTSQVFTAWWEGRQ